MSQGDIEKRTGLLRCYISRMENGHTVPAIDTLEKMAQALEVPVYRLFIDDAAVHKPNIPSRKNPSTSVAHGVKDGEQRVPAMMLLFGVVRPFVARAALSGRERQFTPDETSLWTQSRPLLR